MHLGLGFVTIALAVDEGFAEGKVRFAHERWRWALGAVGVYLTYRAARGLVRSINRATIEYGPKERSRARLRGLFILLIAAGFFIAAQDQELPDRSLAFLSWARPFYTTGAIFLALTGFGQFLNPRGLARQPSAPDAFPEGYPAVPSQYLPSDE